MSSFQFVSSLLLVLVLMLLLLLSSGIHCQTILTPLLSKLRTIVYDPEANIRDPTAVIYDAETETWNFWATHIPANVSKSGYPGRIYHYYCNGSCFAEDNLMNSTWDSSGMAIDVGAHGTFEAYGVFTPGATYDMESKQWILFYGGVENSSSSHTEQIGMATAASAFGPFIKAGDFNPVITLQQIDWCQQTSSNARVDEAKPMILEHQKVMVVKGVCENFTALPGIWMSAASSSSSNSWQPPFVLNTSVSPMFNSLTTADHKGFENVKIFDGPDGYVHMTAHNHGNNECPHYIAQNNNTINGWQFVNMMQSFGESGEEPTPVYPSGSVPGDQTGVVQHFIQFVGSPLHIDLMKLQWS